MKRSDNRLIFKIANSTIWSIPKHGYWITHSSVYPGNFAPQVARNLILKYSKEGDTVLDPTVGSGTTIIEAKLLNRNSIGIDINPDAIKLTKNNIKFQQQCLYELKIYVGDLGNLNYIENTSVQI